MAAERPPSVAPSRCRVNSEISRSEVGLSMLSTMTAKERSVDRGRRTGRRLGRELGEQARIGRITAGLSQEVVARASGLSRSALGRIERGQRASVGLVELAAVLAIVGLKLTAAAFPEGDPYPDDVHHRLGDATHDLVPVDAPWRTEVPFPNPGDLRNWDAMTILEAKRIAFEMETHPRDGQELRRRMSRKRRDGGADELVLVLLKTRANQRFWADHAAELAVDFPTPSHEVIRALREGRAPGSGVIMLEARPARMSASRPVSGRT